MMRRHRIVHRWIFLLLALLLPVAFAIAIASRPPLPVNDRIPSAERSR